jgi:tetratricopeptide (TPR) repeat protein
MSRNRNKRRMPASRYLALLLVAVAVVAQAPPSPAKKSPLVAAQQELTRGDLEAASQTLWSLLSSEPANERALTMLGTVRSRQRRYAEAEALFRRVLQITPNSLAGYRNLAGALLAQDKFDHAIVIYQQAETIAPRDVDVKLEVARLEVTRGKFSEAISTLDKIPPAKLPRTALPVKAAGLIGVGRVSEASGLIPQAKGSPAVAMDMAAVFLSAHLPELAFHALDIAARPTDVAATHARERTPVRFYYLRGQAFHAKGDNHSALADWQRALRLDPNFVDTLIAISDLYVAENKDTEALAVLKRARTASHDSALVLRRFIVACMKTHQRDLALRLLPDLLNKAQNAPDDLYLASAVMLEDRQYLQAGELLEQYVGQRPQDAKGLMALGIAYLNQRRTSEARQLLERSLEKDSRLAESEYQLGVLASKEGNGQEAIQHWQSALQKEPEHGKALFSLGNIYLEQGELSKALSALERSAVADPNHAPTEYDLGLVLTKLGRTEEARQHLGRFRKMEVEQKPADGRSRNTFADP